MTSDVPFTDSLLLEIFMSNSATPFVLGALNYTCMYLNVVYVHTTVSKDTYILQNFDLFAKQLKSHELLFTNRLFCWTLKR